MDGKFSQLFDVIWLLAFKKVFLYETASLLDRYYNDEV